MALSLKAQLITSNKKHTRVQCNKETMGDKATILILLLVLCHGVAVTMGYWETEVEGSPRPDKLFMLQKSKSVAKTDAGEMRVLESYGGRVSERRLHIGFITMEPRSLFVPQYLDSSLVMFVRSGEAKVSFIYKDKLAERELKRGDVYEIPAGSAFYLVNTGESQKLHIICSIDPAESLGVGIFESFYIGGGANPASVLSGFETEILETVFNATGPELRKIFTRQHEGPIVHLGDHSSATNIWNKFLQLKEEEKLKHLKRMVQDQEESDDEEEEEQQASWSWRKLLYQKFTHKSPHSCNLYDRKPDFINNYGWSVALDGSDYSPLKSSGIGVYHVNLKAGSMMTPHLNPRATEYGVVLKGSGRIQIVFPNGSNAMDTHIKEGDVFFVPRYFPFCQIAAQSGSLEFFGFTTSARKNRPQFLVGATSIMRTMMGPELATAFGVSEETMRHVVNAQHEAVILPTPWAARAYQNEKKKEEEDKVEWFPRNQLTMGYPRNQLFMGYRYGPYGYPYRLD